MNIDYSLMISQYWTELLKMIIDIVDFSIQNGGSFQFAMLATTRGYIPIKFHGKSPLNHHFPMVFPWLPSWSHGWHMDIQWSPAPAPTGAPGLGQEISESLLGFDGVWQIYGWSRRVCWHLRGDGDIDGEYPLVMSKWLWKLDIYSGFSH